MKHFLPLLILTGLIIIFFFTSWELNAQIALPTFQGFEKPHGVYESGSQTFSYTGAQQTLTVPSGVSTITIRAWGAEGGDGWNQDVQTSRGSAGLGGYATGVLSVSTGNTIYIYVGGSGVDALANNPGDGGYNGGGDGASYSYGNGGYQGGGGGGASDIRNGGTALSNRVIVAAGGGAGSGWCTSGAGDGGNGGGQGGDSGQQCSSVTVGAGGSQSAGGNSGGQSGTGGSATSNGGAGGGGGYYGGGASNGSGGGGGSSYIGGVTSSSTTSGQRSGNGQIIITW